MKQDERGDDEDEFADLGSFRNEETQGDILNDRYSAELTSVQSKAVYRLKAFVLLVLCAVACIVSWIIYTITRRGQISELILECEATGGQILESFHQVLRGRIFALASIGQAFTLHSEATNSSWPFVTMNHFQERALVVKKLSGAMFVQLVTIVQEEDREEWENYVAQEQGWITEAAEYQARIGIDRLFPVVQPQEDVDPTDEEDPNAVHFSYTTSSKRIFNWGQGGTYQFRVSEGPGPYQVVWQSSPLVPTHGTNLDIRSYPTYSKYITKTVETKEVVLGGITTVDPGWPTGPNSYSAFYAMLLTIAKNETTYYQGGPFSEVYIPIFDTLNDNSTVVAVVYGIFEWASLFENTQLKSGDVLNVVLDNACDGSFTYLVSHNSTTYVGAGDLHDRSLSNIELFAAFDDEEFSQRYNVNFNQGGCAYSLHVYPTKQMMDQRLTSLPTMLAVCMSGIMAFTIVMFVIYNWAVESRQKRVLDAAIRTNAIVSAIFPEQVRDRLEAEALQGTTTKLRGFLQSPEEDLDTDVAKGILRYKTKPIADFFASATIMFADVEGFTAWSSTREPFQVFSFLESLYGAFDQLAAKHNIYKVETVGGACKFGVMIRHLFSLDFSPDCYVAVSGLPDPRKVGGLQVWKQPPLLITCHAQDHAVAITRFAFQCVKCCVSLTKRLEVLLGPDTGDLRIRAGLHSGEVTAGVLRGSRSRFQLFGTFLYVVMTYCSDCCNR
jgi:class 3 adenylate cyclase